MSIESRIYDTFYDGMCSLEKKIESLNRDKDVAAIARVTKRNRREHIFFSGIKYLSAAYAIYAATDLTHRIVTDHYNITTYLQSGLAVSSAFLSAHFHYGTKLSDAVDEKLFKRATPELPIEKWRKRGCYSHLIGSLALCATVAPLVYVVGTQNPISTGIALGIGGYCAYHNWFRAYNALYDAQADFVKETRRPAPDKT